MAQRLGAHGLITVKNNCADCLQYYIPPEVSTETKEVKGEKIHIPSLTMREKDKQIELIRESIDKGELIELVSIEEDPMSTLDLMLLDSNFSIFISGSALFCCFRILIIIWIMYLIHQVILVYKSRPKDKSSKSALGLRLGILFGSFCFSVGTGKF